MIHWAPEGFPHKFGLNFYATNKKKFWFRIILKLKTQGFYFRFRTLCSPHFIFNRISYDC